ncbi:hypothetical protein Bpfe_017785 [Biomphalaria pfeifferi]|uniref:Uncharacterized protein n=1 Tax=Biomphalaria pfeifferi TaxID=112525 RepID=A0AAD8F7A3_BIOPF|nr:hypothetical protein Bpfe_017785 [Biomphalaria pfeifferi]
MISGLNLTSVGLAHLSLAIFVNRKGTHQNRTKKILSTSFAQRKATTESVCDRQSSYFILGIFPKRKKCVALQDCDCNSMQYCIGLFCDHCH